MDKFISNEITQIEKTKITGAGSTSTSSTFSGKNGGNPDGLNGPC
ncbi:hypothetical protein [Flavobacterium sp.]